MGIKRDSIYIAIEGYRVNGCLLIQFGHIYAQLFQIRSDGLNNACLFQLIQFGNMGYAGIRSVSGSNCSLQFCVIVIPHQGDALDGVGRRSLVVGIYDLAEPLSVTAGEQRPEGQVTFRNLNSLGVVDGSVIVHVDLISEYASGSAKDHDCTKQGTQQFLRHNNTLLLHDKHVLFKELETKA